MNKEHQTKALGQYVRSRRHQKGLSLHEAEAASHVDHSYWSKLERGEYQTPNPRYLGAIARALGSPPEDLYALAGYDVPERLPAFSCRPRRLLTWRSTTPNCAVTTASLTTNQSSLQ